MPIVNPTLPADGDDAVVAPYNTAIQAILGVLNGFVDSDNLAAGAVGLSELATVVQSALMPSGALTPYGGSTAPTGWLMCDGSSQLRSSFSALFAVVGTSFGSVDGTHFNLPDMRGRTAVGGDAMGGTAANRAQHTSTLTTTSGSSSAVVGSASGLSLGMFITAVGVTAGTTIVGISGTTITMSANATANGSSVAVRFSLLGNDGQTVGAAGGSDTHQLTVVELAAHNHVQNNSGAISNIAVPGYGSGARPTFVDGTVVSTNNAGGDQPHTIMQPSLVTNYIIKT